MRYVIVPNIENPLINSIGLKQYQSYCEKMELIKLSKVNYDQWKIKMNVTLNNFDCWKINKMYEEDLFVNCTDEIRYFSNDYIKFFNVHKLYNENEDYSYFIRKDYMKRLLYILETNENVLPLFELIQLLKFLEVDHTNHLHLVLTDGLGNRMFQIASMYAICKEYNYSLYISISSNKHSSNTYKFITKNFDKSYPEKINKLLENNGVNFLKESSDMIFDYDKKLVDNIKKNKEVLVHGYFQSKSYFQNYMYDIREIFKCPENIQNHIYEKYPNINSCWFIHIRLKDYVESKKQCDKHYVDLSEYYEKHLSRDDLLKDSIYLFSDDSIENAYIYYPFLTNYQNIKYVNEPDEVISFYMMSFCKKGGICANSTFSWWAGELNDNPNKKIFRPSKMINNHKGIFNMY